MEIINLGGVSLRDFFAISVSQELINCIIPDSRRGNGKDIYMNVVAEYRYKYADAMILARESINPSEGK